jgi:hypothetical protein
MLILPKVHVGTKFEKKYAGCEPTGDARVTQCKLDLKLGDIVLETDFPSLD